MIRLDDSGMPAWGRRAACLNHPDPDLWFAADATEALAICEECPVRIECGDYAMGSGFEFGTWGGMSEKVLRQARRMDRAA